MICHLHVATSWGMLGIVQGTNFTGYRRLGEGNWIMQNLDQSQKTRHTEKEKRKTMQYSTIKIKEAEHAM